MAPHPCMVRSKDRVAVVLLFWIQIPWIRVICGTFAGDGEGLRSQLWWESRSRRHRVPLNGGKPNQSFELHTTKSTCRCLNNHGNRCVLLKVNHAGGQPTVSLPSRKLTRMFLIESSTMMSFFTWARFGFSHYGRDSRTAWECLGPGYACDADLPTTVPVLRQIRWLDRSVIQMSCNILNITASPATPSKWYHWGTANHAYLQPMEMLTRVRAVPGGINAAYRTTTVYPMAKPNRTCFLSDFSRFHRKIYLMSIMDNTDV